MIQPAHEVVDLLCIVSRGRVLGCLRAFLEMYRCGTLRSVTLMSLLGVMSTTAFSSDAVLEFLSAFETQYGSDARPSVSELRSFAASIRANSVIETQPWWPAGNYNASCTDCTLDGLTLACNCSGPGLTSLVLSSCTEPVTVTNRNGYLHCNWTDVPPPRVGALIGPSDGQPDSVYHMCRVLEQTTFLAPQMSPTEPPLSIRPASAIDECCRSCTQYNLMANSTVCRAWTFHNGAPTFFLFCSCSLLCDSLVPMKVPAPCCERPIQHTLMQQVLVGTLYPRTPPRSAPNRTTIRSIKVFPLEEEKVLPLTRTQWVKVLSTISK